MYAEQQKTHSTNAYKLVNMFTTRS